MDDNVAVKRAAIEIAATEYALERNPAEPGIFEGRLPELGNGRSTARIIVVDEHGIRGESELFELETQTVFWSDGNIVLLVFATVLFLASVSIYVKMGRKRRPA